MPFWATAPVQSLRARLAGSWLQLAEGVTAGDLGGGRPVDQGDLVVAVEGQSARAAGHLLAVDVGAQRGISGGGLVPELRLRLGARRRRSGERGAAR